MSSVKGFANKCFSSMLVVGNYVRMAHPLSQDFLLLLHLEAFQATWTFNEESYCCMDATKIMTDIVKDAIPLDSHLYF